VLAVAIQTVVFGACAAGHLDLFPHGLACAMNAHGRISFGDARQGGEIREAAVAQIYCRQRLAILRL
jgi:hypothetical protein